MQEISKTSQDLIMENSLLKQRVLELEKVESEQKQAEQKLKASEIRYRRIFETAKDGIIIIDAETGRVNNVNPAVIDMLGYSCDEFLGKTLWEIEPFKNTIIADASFLGLQESKDIRYDNLQLTTKDGWDIFIELVGNLYKVGNKRVVQFNIRNVSDLRWAEELVKQEKEVFFTVLENDPIGVALFDENGMYHYVNPAFTRITGYSLDDIPTGRDWFHKAYPDPDYRHNVISCWYDGLDKIRKCDKNRISFRIICKGGTEKILNFISIQFKTGEYMTTCWDVTNEKRAEEERERIIVQLQKALANIKTLSGLLPICASCKKVRNDKGYWEQIEIYVRDRSEAEFSHGICPECAEKLYPEYYKKQ